MLNTINAKYFYFDQQSHAVYEISTKQQNAHQVLQLLYGKIQSKEELAFSNEHSINTLVERVVSGYKNKLGLLQRIWECFLALFSYFKIYLSKTQQIYHYAHDIENSSLSRKKDPLCQLRQSLIDQRKSNPEGLPSEMEILQASAKKVIEMGIGLKNPPAKVLTLAAKCAHGMSDVEMAFSALKQLDRLEMSHVPILSDLLVNSLLQEDLNRSQEFIRLMNGLGYFDGKDLGSALRKYAQVSHIAMLIDALHADKSPQNWQFNSTINEIIPVVVNRALDQPADANVCRITFGLIQRVRLQNEREWLALSMRLFNQATQCHDHKLAKEILQATQYTQKSPEEVEAQVNAIVLLSRVHMAESRYEEAKGILELSPPHSRILSPLKETLQELYATAMQQKMYGIAFYAARSQLFYTFSTDAPLPGLSEARQAAIVRLNEIVTALPASEVELRESLEKTIEVAQKLLAS